MSMTTSELLEIEERINKIIESAFALREKLGPRCPTCISLDPAQPLGCKDEFHAASPKWAYHTLDSQAKMS